MVKNPLFYRFTHPRTVIGNCNFDVAIALQTAPNRDRVRIRFNLGKTAALI